MLVTLSPKIYVVTCEPKMLLRFELYVYAFETMLLLLMVTLVRPVQIRNASLPMVVTELGMVKVVRNFCLLIKRDGIHSTSFPKISSCILPPLNI